MLLEETGQRQQATAMRLNRELNRNAERFDATIKQVDKLQTRNLNELREQFDTNIIMVERQMEQSVLTIKAGM
jgi:ABC-type phosphate transport system auxiliary subunit